MSTRFLVLCAIALFSGFLPGFWLSPSPAQAAAYTVSAHGVNTRGVDVYRENLTRLRSNTMNAGSARSNATSLDSNALPQDSESAGTDVNTRDNSPDGASSTARLPQSISEFGVMAQDKIERGKINLKGTAETALSSLKEVTSQRLDSNHLTDKLTLGTTALQSIRKSIQQPSETRQDPYAIIAAAQQQPNPLKGENPFRSNSFFSNSFFSNSFRSNPFRSDKIAVSLPRIQPSAAQTALKQRTLQVKDQVTAQVKDSLPTLVTSPQNSIKQKIEEMSNTIKVALFNALSWTEQTAHNAAEQVKH